MKAAEGKGTGSVTHLRDTALRIWHAGVDAARSDRLVREKRVFPRAETVASAAAAMP